MTFEVAKDKFSKDLLIKEYITDGKSKEIVAKENGISICLLNRLLDFYQIKKTKEQIDKSKTRCIVEHSSKRKEETDKVSAKITKDTLVKLYIEDNMRQRDIAKMLDVSEYCVYKLITSYGIKKSKKESYILGIETKSKEYGSIENYNASAREKAVKTILKTYESMEDYYAKIGEKVSSTVEKRYGDRHYYNIEAMRNTCKERYGVSAPCMLPQARMRGNNSKPNMDFEHLLKQSGIDFEREFSIENYSYDFKIGKILVEINPTITHNSSYSPFGYDRRIERDYHAKKALCARRNGYRCIFVWDWDDVNKIISLLRKREKINARECSICDVSYNEATDFINKYHLQGYAKDEIRLGLNYKGKLVFIMTFGRPRYNKNFDYELIRLCSPYYVVGGAEKLFSYFVKKYKPKSVVSYCDLSKFNGDVYEKLGFSYKGYSISKHWYSQSKKKHITDSLLRSRGFDQLFGTNYGKGSSNKSLMLDNGFVEIYDAGQARYEFMSENINKILI